MAVKKAVQCGNVEDAIEKVNDLNPEVRIFYFFGYYYIFFTGRVYSVNPVVLIIIIFLIWKRIYL